MRAGGEIIPQSRNVLKKQGARDIVRPVPAHRLFYYTVYLLLFCFLFLAFIPIITYAESPTVIETEISPDQAVDPRPTRPKLQDILPSDSQVPNSQYPVPNTRYPSDLELTDKQIIQLNNSLKTLIEENGRLRKLYNDMNTELRKVRGQRNIMSNRVNTVGVERDNYKKQSEHALKLKDKYSGYLKDIKEEMDTKEERLKAKIKDLQTQLAKIEEAKQSEPDDIQIGTQSPVPGTQRQTSKPSYASIESRIPNPEDRISASPNVLSMLDNLADENRRLQADEAMVRYNMGNLFFQQGEYKKSVEEYKQAVELMPRDASAHFNLAFVSGEYLDDQKTALTHYRQYLYLNPNAEDAGLVQEKILIAELYLRSHIDSRLEKDIYKHNQRIYKK